MPIRRSVEDTPATPHFDFLYGAYRLSSWQVPYFATTMSLRHVADHLQLATDFPGAEEIRWRLEELYQRDIDWPRVERRILPYLSSSTQPQFFNALTIALLPIMESGELAPSFAARTSWTPPDLADEANRYAKVVRLGPITYGYWENWNSLSDRAARTGQIRWNPSEVFGVALDGQHRLAAIQQLAKSAGHDGARLDNTQVPIILLILDSAVGYAAPAQRPLLDILRILFVDLNKHAKAVTRARQILLDDKDPHSVCVRTLVGPQLQPNVDELAATPPRLPLSLVDWHSEQAKFDEGPYVTTMLGLDWLVTRVLGAKPIADYTDYTAIRRQLKALTSALAIELPHAVARLHDIEQLGLQPFSYAIEGEDNGEVGTIAAAFMKVWNAPIVRLLTVFSPYRALIDARKASGSFKAEFSNWYHLYERKKNDRFAGRATDEYKQFVGRLSHREHSPIAEGTLLQWLADAVSLKTGNLAFNVAFQRAYVLGFLDFRQITPLHADQLAETDDVEIPDLDEDEASDEGEESEADEAAADEMMADVQESEGASTELADDLRARADEYVGTMNRLLAEWAEFLSIDALFRLEDGTEELLWAGTLRKAEGGIDFTQGASTRASEVFAWCAIMALYKERRPAPLTFDDFWLAVLAKETYVMRRISRSVNRYADSKDSTAATRILRAKGQRPNEALRREEARKRLAWLWDNLPVE